MRDARNERKNCPCQLTLLHARHLASSHNGHALPGVDAVGRNAVAVQVGNALDGVDCAVQLNLSKSEGDEEGRRSRQEITK
jgi:hypothetical protein